MTYLEIKEYIGNLISHVTFMYAGHSCGIDPLSTDEFDMWCGGNSIKVHSVDEVMTTKFFNGKALEDIMDELTDLEY